MKISKKENMKKYFLIFGYIMQICFFYSAYVFAFEISPESVSGESGDTIIVPIRISNVSTPIEADAIGFTLSFDSDVLTYVESNKADTLTNDFTLLAGQEISPGIVKVVGSLFETPVLINSDDILVNMRFTVLNAASNSLLILSDFKDDIATAATSPAEFILESSTPEDTTPPVITLIGDASITIEQNSSFDDPGATASDDIDGDISYQIEISGNIDTSAAATYTLTYTVSDSAGNEAKSVTRTVTVIEAEIQDSTPPVITLIGDASITIEQNSSFDDPGAAASDDIDGDISDQIEISGNIDTSAAATYTLTYTVSDSAGNEAESVTRTITVIEAEIQDTTPPVITLIGDASITIEQNSSFDDPGATASDDIDGDISDQIEVTSDVDTSVAKSYTLTYKVSDAAGNEAEPVTRTITVIEAEIQDTIPPVITLIGDASITIEQNSFFDDPGATASDDIDGDISDQIAISGSVDTSAAKSYTLTYKVSDAAGNEAKPVTRIITVIEAEIQDTTPPVISLNGTEIVEITKNSAYHDLGAAATDNKDGNISDKISVSSSVDTSEPGEYMLTYTVSDSAGNAADKKTRKIIVLSDNVEPFNMSASFTKNLTTVRPVDIPNTGIIPVNLRLNTGNTADIDEAQITAIFEANTEIGTEDGTNYEGVINPPTQITPDVYLKNQLGKHAVAFTLGSQEQTLTVKNGKYVYLSIDVVMPDNVEEPSVWWIQDDNYPVLAGIDGRKNGHSIQHGGTILKRTTDLPKQGYTTYHLGVLLDHMSDFAIGTKQMDDNDSGCFIQSISWIR